MLAFGSLVFPLLVLGRVPPSGRPVQRLFVASGILAATSFVWLSQIVEAFWILPPLLILGVSMGALNAATALLLRATLTQPRSSSVIELAGIVFTTGGLAICGLLCVLFDRPNTILWLLAALFLLLAWRVRRSNLFEFMAFRPDSSSVWEQLDRSPTGVLLGLALFLQSGI
jgi:hypothetical protein